MRALHGVGPVEVGPLGLVVTITTLPAWRGGGCPWSGRRRPLFVRQGGNWRTRRPSGHPPASPPLPLSRSCCSPSVGLLPSCLTKHATPAARHCATSERTH